MKLCLITNSVGLAVDAEAAGIDRVMVDLEAKGKASRQAGEGLFFTNHRPDDVSCLHSSLGHTAILVRVNGIHHDSEREIDHAIRSGAEIVMLPMVQRVEDVARFVKMVGARVRTCLLIETGEGVQALGEIVAVPGVDEIHIGLNDLRLSLGHDVIFEVLCSGMIDRIARTVQDAGVKFGFGGIARLSAEHLPVRPDRIVAEQVRLGGHMAILGRSFRDEFEKVRQPERLRAEVARIRAAIDRWSHADEKQLSDNSKQLAEEVRAWKEATARETAGAKPHPAVTNSQR